MNRDPDVNNEVASALQTVDLTQEKDDDASEDNSRMSLLCNRPGCKATKPFINRSELRLVSSIVN